MRRFFNNRNAILMRDVSLIIMMMHAYILIGN